MAQKTQGQETILDKALALPLPLDYFAPDENFAVLDKAWRFVARGVKDREELETLLAIGKGRITLESVYEAAQALNSRLALYRRDAGLALSRAEQEQEQILKALENRQASVQAARDKSVSELEGFIEEYSQLLATVQRIKGFFGDEFVKIAEMRKPVRPSRLAPVSKILARMRARALEVVFVPEEGGMTEEKEEEIIEDIQGVAALISAFSKNDAIAAIQEDIGWDFPHMVDLVSEAEGVFTERLEEAKRIKEQRSQEYKMLLAQIQGGIDASQSALSTLAEKRQNIEGGINKLADRIQTVKDLLTT